MTGIATENDPPALVVVEPWSPSPATRFWLLAGIAGLLVDLVAGVVMAVLEQQHWGQKGITPEVWLNYASIVPQLGIVIAWLAVAREIGARSLWKSLAGLFATYLLMQLVSLTLWELLPGGWNVALTVATAIGIVALVTFWFSSWPKFAVPDSGPAVEEESSGGGWGIHILLLLGVFVLRRALKGFQNFLPNVGLDGWAMLELCALGVFALVFAVWFAVAKLRHRDRLGSLAGVLGGTELLILAIHAAMLVALVWLMVSAAQANPQIDDDGWDRLLDPWARRGSLVSAACHAAWALLTAGLFVSLWMRPEPDWRTSFTHPVS